uniref:Uncharacterized protein n=1 Tax=Oryza brachyantha TaxID=4533 RepID=J3N2V9_ORYBR
FAGSLRYQVLHGLYLNELLNARYVNEPAQNISAANSVLNSTCMSFKLQSSDLLGHLERKSNILFG